MVPLAGPVDKASRLGQFEPMSDPSSGGGGATVPAVEVCGLTKDFDRKRAVDGLDLIVHEGEFFGFLGPNGAGKSTTIKMLSGLMRPTAGMARVQGVDVETDALRVKALIGVLPEEAALYDRLTPLEHLRFVGRLHGLSQEDLERRSGELLDLLEIEDADRRKMVIDFSMGMKKKVSLACALIHGPRLLFLDEPFNGIDAVTVRAIRELLQAAVSRGVTIFFSSHILDLVQKLCTRVGVIVQGRLRVLGTIDEIRGQAGAGPEATLEDVFVTLAGGDRVRTGGLDFL
jgi:ABC-2 type transport system ATP-binding protein